MRSIYVAVFSIVVIAGCSDSEPEPEPTSAAMGHKGLSPEYLQGDWCFTHVEFPDERSKENINYHFELDGTYSAQQSKNRGLQPGWKYTFLPDGKFKLSLPRFTTSVVSVEPAEFVLHAFGDIHFRRGACS